MPLSWPTLFRMLVLLALSAHEFVMYNMGRTFGTGVEGTLGAIVLSCLFAFVMLVPLVWAVTLPELPEIYTHYFRAKRRHGQGRCASCGYEIGSAKIERCPECGASIEAPREYVVTAATIRRYIVMNLTAWFVGCAAGELAFRFLPGGY